MEIQVRQPHKLKSMMMSAPVVYPADSLQSQIIAPQSSSGFAIRCMGNNGCHAAINSGSTKSGSMDMGVATYPGLMQFTRIFCLSTQWQDSWSYE